MKKIPEKIKTSFKAVISMGLLFVLTLLLGSACPKPQPKKSCQGWAVYGPRQCSTDEECVSQNGAGWYCNKDHAYTNPCGEKIPWPLCEQKKP